MSDAVGIFPRKPDIEISGTTAPHQLFVGDLPPHLTEDNLRDYFSPYGSILDCRVIRDPVSQRSKCFGFVRFAKNEDAEEAIAQTNDASIDGKKIRTNWAFKRGPTHPLSHEQILAQASGYNTTIYIGGLGQNFSADFVRGMCAMYGGLLEIRLFQEKGYAFVRYDNRDSAAAAILGIHNSEINGHLVRCSWGKEPRDPFINKMTRSLARLPNNAMLAPQATSGLPTQAWPFLPMVPTHTQATQIAANIGNYHISFPYGTPFYTY
ncbi:hypothetical protein RvY_04339-1 [Ramazzottius varieornatus]|uniref:RRM domain-containing protein n=1 Tax=Ramazzottius varieornatus TaxID=947166 RepID=A0A1D1UUP2_RAMVA|nr:hypothetical protein RvY_04339-1 [Ramazzottius varieornatus]